MSRCSNQRTADIAFEHLDMAPHRVCGNAERAGSRTKAAGTLQVEKDADCFPIEIRRPFDGRVFEIRNTLA
jgi:hypothetical protein